MALKTSSNGKMIRLDQDLSQQSRICRTQGDNRGILCHNMNPTRGWNCILLSCSCILECVAPWWWIRVDEGEIFIAENVEVMKKTFHKFPINKRPSSSFSSFSFPLPMRWRVLFSFLPRLLSYGNITIWALTLNVPAVWKASEKNP